MGFVLSRFKKSADSPSTKLELINKELAEIESYRRQNLALQKKTVASLVIYSILLYLVCAILYFVYYFPVLTLSQKCLHSLPLLVFPILIYGVKSFLHWYFVKRISENDLKLADLKEEKNKIIEDVMENETYKKATEILEKYAPNRLHKLNESKDGSVSMSPAASSSVKSQSPNSELRQRTNASMLSDRTSCATPGPNRSVVGPGLYTNTPGSKMTMQQRSMYGGPPGPPLPRQILPRERSYVDKIFESLVGDGPQNRYALICRYCKSHNGMAVPEEFDYLGFRCCYCYHMNEARKHRPNAPRLNLDTTVESSADDCPEDSLPSDSDSDEELERCGESRNGLDISSIQPFQQDGECLQQNAGQGDKKTL